MANTTDKKIRQLIEVVNGKKAEIAKANKPQWNTNCNFVFPDGSRKNLQTISKEADIVEMLATLMTNEISWDKAAEALGSDAKFEWHGFTVSQWQSDFETRLDKVNINKKKVELATLEDRLNKIISPELCAEIELEEITKALE